MFKRMCFEPWNNNKKDHLLYVEYLEYFATRYACQKTASSLKISLRFSEKGCTSLRRANRKAAMTYPNQKQKLARTGSSNIQSLTRPRQY